MGRPAKIMTFTAWNKILSFCHGSISPSLTVNQVQSDNLLSLRCPPARSHPHDLVLLWQFGTSLTFQRRSDRKSHS